MPVVSPLLTDLPLGQALLPEAEEDVGVRVGAPEEVDLVVEDAGGHGVVAAVESVDPVRRRPGAAGRVIDAVDDPGIVPAVPEEIELVVEAARHRAGAGGLAGKGQAVGPGGGPSAAWVK
jgi:hypothetical protein